MAWTYVPQMGVKRKDHILYTETHKDRRCLMNARQLAKLGVPQDCVPQAIQVVQAVAKHNRSVPKDQRIDVEQAIRDLRGAARSYREERPDW